MAALLALVLSACASNIPVNGDRNFNTSLREGESIGLVLASYGACYHHNNRECGPESNLTAKQREFEICMSRAIKAENQAVNVVPSENFMPALAQHFTAGVGGTPELHLESPALIEKLTALGVKYLVSMEVQTEESEPRTKISGELGLFAIGREVPKRTLIVSRIYEVASGNEAGHLDTRLTGAGGWSVPVLLFIPLPPIPYSAATESHACTTMGEALAKFIAGAGNSGQEQPAN